MSPERSAPSQLNSGFLVVRVSELQITQDPDEKIVSDFESDDLDFNQEKQENDDDDDGNAEQSWFLLSYHTSYSFRSQTLP